MDEESLPQEFRIEVDRTGDNKTVRLFGELDLVNAEDLEAVLVELAAPVSTEAIASSGRESGTEDENGHAPFVSSESFDGGPRIVVADLSHLEFIDSTGLSALLVARHRIALLGARLQIRGAAGAARRVFEAAGLEDVLDD